MALNAEAQYDADRARYRYMQVDPANRLVADSLEADWNGRLRAAFRALRATAAGSRRCDEQCAPLAR